jgi:Domain of unknown function (DUF1883).
MNFTHYNLGHVERGSVVVVTLSGSAANVRLMDGSNFNSYKAGRRHSYVGGLAKRSPVRLLDDHLVDLAARGRRYLGSGTDPQKKLRDARGAGRRSKPGTPPFSAGCQGK